MDFTTMDEVYTYESESNTIPSNQNLKQEIYKIYDQKNKLLTNKNISMRKLQIFFNIRINRATSKASQLSWKIIHNTVYTEAKLQKNGAIYE